MITGALHFAPVGFRCLGVLFGTLIFLVMKALSKEVMDVKIQSATLDYANPAYLGPSTFVRVYRKSRSKPPCFMAYLPLHRDLPLETNISYHAFQKFRNGWRSTVIKGTSPLCAMLESKNKLIRMYFDYSDFPRKCPVKQGNYTFKDMSFSGDLMPPLLPAAEFRTKVTYGIPQANIFSYFTEIKIDKKGKPGSDYSEVAAILSVNKTLSLN